MSKHIHQWKRADDWFWGEGTVTYECVGCRRLRILRIDKARESRQRYEARQPRSVAFLRHANTTARRLGRTVVDVTMVLPEGPCTYCGGPSETWDHIVPFSQGGETTVANLAPACHACNRRKSRYGTDTAKLSGTYLCGWCWSPIHRQRSNATRRDRPVRWFACSQSHANILRRWGGLAFGNPEFAGPRTRLVAA